MSAATPQGPARPTRMRLFDREGALLLQAPGKALRVLGAPRRYAMAALVVWLSVVSAGIALGWALRGLI